MATVQRANVILQVADDADTLQRYKNKGFNVIDRETGKILQKAVPHDAGELKIQLLEMQTELNAKDIEIVEAKKEISKLKKEISKLRSAKK